MVRALLPIIPGRSSSHKQLLISLTPHRDRASALQQHPVRFPPPASARQTIHRYMLLFGPQDCALRRKLPRFRHEIFS